MFNQCPVILLFNVSNISLERIINAFTVSFFWSTLLIGFFIVKGGFQKKYLFTDNVLLAIMTTIAVMWINFSFSISPLLRFFIITPGVTFLLFILLFFYRFFRNPARKTIIDKSKVYSPADGRVIYIKELDENCMPVSVKKRNMNRLDELTKTDMLKTPCYLVGIAMTLFDVHYNRSPVEGMVKLIQHTDGSALGLRRPESTFINERNTFVIEDTSKNLFGVIQIAARGVRRCIPMVAQGANVSQGQLIGKIRFGSQVDMIIPRKYFIQVREGDQVFAGTSIIADLS